MHARTLTANTAASTSVADSGDAIDRKPVVAARIGVSVRTLERMAKDGEFPSPVRVSAGRIGWKRSVVDAWIASRGAAR